MPKVLVVDDEQSISWGVSKLCRSLGHETKTASSAETGIRTAQTWRPDLVVLDVRLPSMDGLSAMEHFRSMLGDIPIIIITAFGDMPTALKAVQNNAFEYLLKPFGLAEIQSAVERALAARVPSLGSVKQSEDGLVGESPSMQALYRRIALAASSNVSVLLRGESGAGKELVARAIHRHSARSSGHFVAVNVAALSPTLAESELFGHVDGAFTGANRSRRGLLAQADGGTLFLDELAEIPIAIQIKLLRALEEGEVLPLGADRPVKTDFRVVAATHQNLLRCVEMGQFRHDLYYRICAFEIPIPALRERTQDIPQLAAYFISQTAYPDLQFSNAALEALMARPWPGNVRELRNAVDHASVLARSGEILPEHLPATQHLQFQAPQANPANHTANSTTQAAALTNHTAPSFREIITQHASCLLEDASAYGAVHERFLAQVEIPLLLAAMNKYQDECAVAARALGLHRTTLKRKLEQYDLWNDSTTRD